MSLKKYFYDKDIQICRTCKFIDEYALNVAEQGEAPLGYDGTAICCKFDKTQKETIENRCFISPSSKSCSKYEKCTEKQALYLDIFDVESQTIIPNPNDISKIDE